MLPESLLNRMLWIFVGRIDSCEVERVRREGCGHCGGVLDCAQYMRKPRRVSSSLVGSLEGVVLRHSFCCADCGKRTTPASVRVFGLRVYAGLIFLLLPALPGDRSPSAALSARDRHHLSERILRHWHRWWPEQLSARRFCRAHRGRLVPGAATRLPGNPVASFRGGCIVATA